jgi:hypothetical protein
MRPSASSIDYDGSSTDSTPHLYEVGVYCLIIASMVEHLRGRTPMAPSARQGDDEQLSKVLKELEELKKVRQEQANSELRDILKELEELKKVRQKQANSWLSRVGAAMGAVILFLGVGFFLHYFDLRDERSSYRQEAEKLRLENRELLALRELMNQYTALETYALQQRKLTQQEVSRFVEKPARRAPVGSRVLQITDPAEGRTVGEAVIVRGIYHEPGSSTTCWEDDCSLNQQASQRTIWMVIKTAGVNVFYPQGNWKEQVGPAFINRVGEWHSPAVFLGKGATEKERAYLLLAVRADSNTEEAFKDYLREASETESSPGMLQLPEGAEVMDTVLVIRK